MQPRNKLLHFVRGLLGGDGALARGTYYVTTGGRRAAASDVMQLVRAGAIDGDHAGCRANGATAGWLKRMMIDCDAFQAQHRQLAHDAEGRAINLKESPLMRLAAGEAAFLERHHVETGERVRRLVERAQLRQRLTMSYSGVGREGKAGSKASEISEMAADARRAVADIYRTLPPNARGWWSMSAAGSRACRRWNASGAGRGAAPSSCCASGSTSWRVTTGSIRTHAAARRARSAAGSRRERGPRCGSNVFARAAAPGWRSA